MKNSFVKSSFWVTVVLVIGYILSFVKEASIANYYGVSFVVDAYTIAIQVPVTIFSFVACALRAVVIPLYSDLYYKSSLRDANNFANNLTTLAFLVSILFVIVGEIGSDLIITLFAPGFNEETHQLARYLLMITLPTMVFSVAIDVLNGILNVHKKFVLPSLAVYFLNLSIIFFIVILHNEFGIAAACIGQVVGSFLQMLYLYLLLRKTYRFKLYLDINDITLKKAIRMSGPTIWSISIAEINAIVNRIVASFLFVGSISALGYASKINSIFMTFFVSAISVIVYPLYAESTAKNDYKQLARRVNFTLSLYSALLIPLMCVIFCFRREIVTIAFARGAFGEDAIVLTKELLGCYTVSILFLALRETVSKVFLSMKDTATIAKNATWGVILNIILNLTLPYIWGVYGLAIATSISAIFISVRLVYLLNKKENLHLSDYYYNLWRIIGASLIMTFVTGGLYMAHINDNPYIVFIVGGFISFGIYIAALLFFRAPITQDVINLIKSR